MANVVQVIVNAKDLGASQMVNDVTFDLVAQGKVTSATMIANAPFLDDALHRIGGYNSCSFGVHLNLSEFQPLTDSRAIQDLLDDNGRFAGYDRVRNVDRNSELTNGVFSEFCAQIDLCKSAGLEISHLDSHHHVHTLPWIFPILKRIQKRYNVRRLRISKNLYRSTESPSIQLKAKKAAYNFLLRHYFSTATTGAFSDLLTFYECATARVLMQNKVEVMVHPGHVAYEGNAEETELLRSPWESRLKFPVELISYSDLPAR